MAEAHEEQEPDPVEKESGDEGRAEDKVVAEQGGVADIVLPVLAGPPLLSQTSLLQHVVRVHLV